MAFGGAVKLTGESEYKKALNSITDSLRLMSSQMELVTTTYGKNDSSLDGLTSKNTVLNSKLEEQTRKVDLLKDVLAKAEAETGKNSVTVQKWQTELNKAQTELVKTTNELNNNKDALDKAQKEYDDMNSKSKTSINSLRDLTAEILKSAGGASNLGQTIKNDLSVRLDEFKTGVKTSVDNVKTFGSTILDNIVHPKKLGEAIKTGLIDTADKIKNSSKENSQSIEDFGKSEDKVGEQTLKLGDIIKANLISEAVISGIKALGSAVKTVGSTFFDVGKQAMNSFADYEQLSGGVETLFKGSSKTVENYANNAYKTAGLSANEYMSTVTSFSASLLQSLHGDTAKSAKVADMAITDMADNANKMGTDMSSIQTAYQGFAKQNYTMLDNLKLGYGGTKEEMQRLLKDATKLSGVKYDISNLNDVYQAIHVVQGELGITGTTAKEASTTIQGSVASMKTAWGNMLTGMANENANFSQLISNLVESVLTATGNILPKVDGILNGIISAINGVIPKLLPQIIQMATDLITKIASTINANLPALMNTATTIINTLINGIVTILPKLIPIAIEIIMTVVNALIQSLPTILKAGIDIFLQLIQGITQTLPTLIPTIVDAVILIVETLLDNIDLIIDAGIKIIFGLIDGIIKAMPKLIDKMPEIIDKLINAIVNNLPKILNAGIQLCLKLLQGILDTVPKITDKLPQIIASIHDGFINGLGQMLDVGKNLVQGIWQGISSMTQWIKDNILRFAKTITDSIKSFFGIHSPSVLFKNEIGKNLALGVGEGFTENMNNVVKDMQKALPTEFDTGINTILDTKAINKLSSGNFNTFDMIDSLKGALKGMAFMIDGDKMGELVVNKVEKVVFAQ